MTPQLKNKTKLKTIRLIWNIKHRRVHMHFLFFLHVHYNVHVQPWYYKESPVATTPATQTFVMARNIARNIACKKISECNQLVIQIFFTSNTLILTAPIMWSRHWLIDTPLPPLLVCRNNLAKNRQMVVPEASTFGWRPRTDTCCRTTWHDQQQRRSGKFSL